jgi:hypothetical protein
MGEPLTGCRLHVDRVNGRGLDNDKLCPIAEWQGLRLRGWIVAPRGLSTNHLLVGLRRLSGGEQGVFYIARIDSREPRPDVVAALKLDYSEVNAGFYLRALLRGVQSGIYALEFICPAPHSPTSGLVATTSIRLQIG